MAKFDAEKYRIKSDGDGGNKFNAEKYRVKENGPSLSATAVRKGLQGATAGFSDEIAGGVETLGRLFGVQGAGGPMKDMSWQAPSLENIQSGYTEARDQEREKLKQDQEFNPKMSIAAEIAGGIASPINKVTGGMSTAKQGLTMGGLYGTGSSEADSVAGTVLDAAKGAALGFGSGKLFDKAAHAIGPKINQAASNVANKISPAQAKASKDQIIAAADRLGIKVTPAMLDDTGFVERLEYTLANSPSLFGQRVAKAQRGVADGLESAANETLKDATTLTEHQVGERVKSGMTAKVGERLDPIQATFQKVKESTSFIPVSQKSKDAITRNIQKTDEFVLSGGTGKIGDYTNMLQRVENADQLKTMMSMLNGDISAAQGAEKQALIALKNKLGSLEENTIMREAVKQARDGNMNTATGQKIGTEVVGELRDARNNYRSLMSDLGDVAQDARLGKNQGPTNFLDKVENLPSESLQQRFFNPDNQRQLQNLAKNFPEEFDLLRQGKLRDISDAVANGRGGTSINKFLIQVNKLSPEAKEIVFKGNGQVLDDLMTINQSMPRNFNPSGSGTQAGWQEALYSNVRDLPNYLLYKGASTNLGKKALATMNDGLGNTVRDVSAKGVRSLSAPAARVEGAFVSTDAVKNMVADQSQDDVASNQKGPNRWAADGAKNLQNAGVSQEQINQLKKTESGKSLLYEAQGLKANSARMKSVLNRVGQFSNKGIEKLTQIDGSPEFREAIDRFSQTKEGREILKRVSDFDNEAILEQILNNIKKTEAYKQSMKGGDDVG